MADPALSIVVPVLNEGAVIETLMALLAPLRDDGAEVLVVDGGSADDTVARASAAGARVIASSPGRAQQMNAGADAARGRLLWFLHADAQPSPPVCARIARLCRDPAAAWGRFDIRLDASAPVYRVIECAINLRSRLTRIATGDQGIFVTRTLFAELGGFAVIPLMEDVELCRRLRAHRAPLCLSEQLGASARRWQRQGVSRTIVRMWVLRAAYFAGVSPATLARRYPPCPSPADC